MHGRLPLEPRGVDEENDAGQHDLAEPSDDKEECGKKYGEEPKLGKPNGWTKVEYVPRQPEDQRAYDNCREN